MILTIVITVIITSIIIGLWSKYAYTKGNKNVCVVFEALRNELDLMSQKLGYEDIHEYWVDVKGKEYAEKASANMESTLTFLRNG